MKAELISVVSLFCGALLCASAVVAEPTPTDQSTQKVDETTTERLPLWPDEAPDGSGKMEKSKAAITVSHPAKPNGTAVIICPGGGYSGLMTMPEGHGIAKWLAGYGVTGVVLEYRLPKGRPYVPLLDAQRAIRTARQNAKAWNIDPNKIGIMGFSAGGHLASTAGTHFDAGTPTATDPIERVSSRPDFMALIYPVITMGEKAHRGSRDNLLGPAPEPKLVTLFSNETQVSDKTPPTFLAHAVNDTLVPPDNSQDFFTALRAHQVPSEYLELPSGGHGLNGYKGPMWEAWKTALLKWMELQKLILPQNVTN
jgi:acetyl esterase/lipase